jgi:phospholipid-binding lipoprotein MlaA
MRLILALIAALCLGACATTGERAGLDPRDPYEGFNRNVWAFNQAADKVVVKPVTTVYRTVTPVPARRGLTAVLRNLSEPFSIVNALLQGKPDRAFNSLGRFLINTTIGVGGLADHATDLGLPPTREDFGQTLHHWGAEKSPYLVLPLIGPSTVRDGVGTAVQVVADPAQVITRDVIGMSGTERNALTATRIIDARSQAIDSGYDSVIETSADPYAAARSTYFQRREQQLADEDGNQLREQTPEEEQELLDRALEEDAVVTEPPDATN